MPEIPESHVSAARARSHTSWHAAAQKITFETKYLREWIHVFILLRGLIREKEDPVDFFSWHIFG